MKRLLDFLLAAVGMVVLAPLMAVVAIWVRLDSAGPALFQQQRVGRNGVPFDILKFRTMSADTDGDLITAAGDARITKAGRLLRASKVDELPQLWNVLRGDMSLVGPRPEVEKYVAKWPPSSRQVILSVRPGITDPGSIQYRHESEILANAQDPLAEYLEVVMPRKVQIYEEYVKTRTMLGDLRIIIRTVRQIFRGDAADA